MAKKQTIKITKDKITPAREYNFDGLPGPTHNYANLFINDNLAATKNRQKTSNPREAALQSLEKMKLLMDMGFPQAILPPHYRPDIDFLKIWALAAHRKKYCVL